MGRALLIWRLVVGDMKRRPVQSLLLIVMIVTTTTTVSLIDAANTTFNTAFTQGTNSAGNYVKFSITASGFMVSATPGAASDGNPRAPLNALQIVPK